jgi:hypothetical protein
MKKYVVVQTSLVDDIWQHAIVLIVWNDESFRSDGIIAIYDEMADAKAEAERLNAEMDTAKDTHALLPLLRPMPTPDR